MELKDWLNSINFNKEDLSEHIKDYSPYIINRCLSGHLDCVMFANEMNKYNFLSKDMHINENMHQIVAKDLMKNIN